MADVAQRQLVIQPARRVHGTLQVPGDKSIAHRYAMLGAIAEGTTDIAHLAPGEDVATSLACMRALGATIERRGPLAVRITGCGARGLAAATAPLDAGNSGTTMRLLAGIVASYPITTVMTATRPQPAADDPRDRAAHRHGRDHPFEQRARPSRFTAARSPASPDAAGGERKSKRAALRRPARPGRHDRRRPADTRSYGARFPRSGSTFPDRRRVSVRGARCPCAARQLTVPGDPRRAPSGGRGGGPAGLLGPAEGCGSIHTDWATWRH